MHPSTLELLDQLGWADELLKRPHGKVSSLSLQLGNQQIKIADLSTLNTRFPYIALIRRWTFSTSFGRKRRSSLTFTCRWARTYFLSWREGEPFAEFSSRDTIGLGGKSALALLVVGADGRFSRVRQLGPI